LDTDRIERVESDLDGLIERRSLGQDKTNALEEAWKASEKKYHERRRRQNLALWYDFFLSMADSHARLATSYEERALRLLEEGGGGSIANA
jgi:hypothetical protein